MKMLWRYLIGAAVAALGIAATVAGAGAETYPGKPIRMVVPFPPGAASDFLARTVGQKLADIYKQQIVIDNRPGAGGLIGSQIVAKAVPDGYTMALVGQPHLSNVLLREQKPYDPLKDFTAVSLVASLPNVIVIGNGVPAKNVAELVALAKARPGSLNFGSAGVGSSSHLAAAMFLSSVGIQAVHVPFKTLGDIFSEMIAGRVHFYIFPLPAAMPMLKEGRLRAIAVATPKRAVSLPDVPTTAESGFPQYQSDSWFGIVAPAGVPKTIIARFNADTVRVLQDPDTRDRFLKQGAEPRPSTPEGFYRMQSEEYKRLARLIKDIGMKPL
ncbi:MAG TPA: tripartite tricarboxylate transporter substrate binding protein [Burkholderiales bacterium]|nr:tripartite tricarboxylate transporter substrate binding protein [Burkholderiales bacterium]